jgi:predicted lysophospholipase L1 biosynthesis ABC-type transport system permease subunit
MRGRTIRPVFLQFLFVFVVLIFVGGVLSALVEPIVFQSADENIKLLETSEWLFAAASTAGLMLPRLLAWFIVGIAASVVMRVRVSPHMWVYALICDAVMILPLVALVSDGDALWILRLWVTFIFFIGCDAAVAGGGCWLGARIRPWGKAALRACHSRS